VTRVPSVFVVGAGLAGLHAAWRLHEAGADVVVLEARDRVGGRTWSHTFADGTVVERGGEFIAPDDDVLRGLAVALGLELVPHGFSFDRRPSPGAPAPSESELEAFAAAAAARCAQLADDVAASEVVDVSAAPARRAETSLTVPLADASARRLFGAATAHGYDPAMRVRGGNQSIALELARRLRGRVWLRSAVVAVQHTPGGVTLVTADGHRRQADAAVLAMPLPLLQELDLRPGLQPEVRHAITRTRFGDAAKLHVPLGAAPAPGAMASPEATWWCWTSQAADGGAHAAPVLSCFAGGAGGVAALNAEAALALRPDVAPAAADEPLLTHWGTEPWTRGSYSAPGIGSTEEDDAAWTKAYGSIIFAGEHTAGERSATMNGAAASGARAAEAVLELLSQRPR
jgi:monoamine oxidase